ncbi:MAG: P-loop NTPase [Alistipes sp.]
MVHPAELPDNRYYIFGQGEAARLAEREKLPLLASIPLIRSVSEAADSGRPVAAAESPDGKFYDLLAEGVVAGLSKSDL